MHIYIYTHTHISIDIYIYKSEEQQVMRRRAVSAAGLHGRGSRRGVGRLSYGSFVGFMFLNTLFQNFDGVSPEFHQNFTRIHRNATIISPEFHQNFARVSNWSTLKKGDNHNSAFLHVEGTLSSRTQAGRMAEAGQPTANLRTKILDFRGFDASRILNLRVEFLGPW